VPKLKYRALKKGEYQLLYQIWLLRRKHIRATRAVLAQVLRVAPSGVDRIIHNLRNDISRRSYVLSKPVPQGRTEEKPKSKPTSHYVLAEKTLITKPISASLLLRLRQYPRTGRKMVDRQAFTADMVELLNVSAGEVGRLVERGIEKNYIVTVGASGKFIADAERTLHEERYLKLLARHFVRSKPRSSAAAAPPRLS
jgi:hypothetical protein